MVEDQVTAVPTIRVGVAVSQLVVGTHASPDIEFLGWAATGLFGCRLLGCFLGRLTFGRRGHALVDLDLIGWQRLLIGL